MGANPHANGGKILVDLDIPALQTMRLTSKSTLQSTMSQLASSVSCCETYLPEMRSSRISVSSVLMKPILIAWAMCLPGGESLLR